MRNPALGWTAYPDPNGYFDWTGSNITIQYVYAPGGSGYQPPVQNVRAYFSSMVSFGPPSILAATLQARGNPSTYKWQWIPPSIPSINLPDEIHFPAPPLFVLGQVHGNMQGYAQSPLVHITGSLGVDGQNWTQGSTDHTSFDFVGPNMQSASLLSRSVLSAGTSFDIASVQMTPKVDGHGETAPNSTGQPTQGGGIRFSLGNDGFPIILAAPYPFGLPQMGDDTNNFVYDGSFSGVLTLPTAATTVVAAQADTQWLVDTNQVDWTINPAIEGLKSYTKQAQGPSICPVTDGQSGVTKYVGLPDSESGFGNKELFLNVQGNKSQKAYIQIFFPAAAQNNPNFFIDPIPNWFYYYNKIFPASPAVYEDIPISQCYSNSTSDPEPYHFPKVTGVSIGNDAYQTDAIRVFVPTSTVLKWDGVLSTRGIHTYIYTVGHELGHKWDIENGLVNRKFSNSDAWNQGFDADGVEF